LKKNSDPTSARSVTQSLKMTLCCEHFLNGSSSVWNPEFSREKAQMTQKYPDKTEEGFKTS
jgi:hypothetical protein